MTPTQALEEATRDALRAPSIFNTQPWQWRLNQASVDAVGAALSCAVRLHRVRYDQMPMFAIAAAVAGSAQTADPAYLNELMRWSNRPQWSNDGVPHATEHDEPYAAIRCGYAPDDAVLPATPRRWLEDGLRGAP